MTAVSVVASPLFTHTHTHTHILTDCSYSLAFRAVQFVYECVCTYFFHRSVVALTAIRIECICKLSECVNCVWTIIPSMPVFSHLSFTHSISFCRVRLINLVGSLRAAQSNFCENWRASKPSRINELFHLAVIHSDIQTFVLALNIQVASSACSVAEKWRVNI